MDEERSTPRADGFSMPAEWEPHEACYMEWPTLTRRDFWADRFDEAKHDYAAVANAIAAFEPVVMVCDPDQETEARRSCSETIEIVTRPHLLLTVCDVAREELGSLPDDVRLLHWSIPDPALTPSASAFDQALRRISSRVDRLALHVLPPRRGRRSRR